MAGSSGLEGHFWTGLRARFSSAWSNVGCGVTQLQSSFLFCLLLQAEYGQASGQMLLKNLIVRKKGC